MEDFEDWEAVLEFTEAEDWPGLVKWRKVQYLKTPNEHYSQYYYAEALIYNREYDEAMRILKKAYRESYDSTDITHSILDVLFRTGRTECDFEWTHEAPIVLRLDEKLVIACKTFLKGKRKHRSFTDIYCNLLMGYYLFNSEKEICEFLIKSEKFDVIIASGGSMEILYSMFKNKLTR